MKLSKVKKSVLVMGAGALILSSIAVYAQQGRGRMQQGMGMGPEGQTLKADTAYSGCNGFGRRGGRGGGGMMATLTDDERAKLRELRQAFQEETKDLRQAIHQKKLALRSELAKKAPNAEQAGILQQEISEIKSKVSQMRLANMLKIKEIAPSVDPFFMKSGHRGGWGHHQRGRGCPGM